MTHPCEEQRALLIAYLKDELAPLEKTRLDSHLGHCRRCVQVKDELARAFGATSAWTPEIAEEHLDGLVERLSPYILEAERARQPRPFALAFAAAAGLAVAMLFVFVVLPRMMTTVQENRQAIAKTEPAPIAEPEKTSAAVLAVRPTPHIKLVASASWDGRVEALDDVRSEITMKHGFAVIEFEGGQGRHLMVHAPGVDVEVVGTRFFVDVAPDGGSSVVGVKKGRVRAVTKTRQDEIDAGDARAYAPDGELSKAAYAPRATEYLEDTSFGTTATEPEPEPQAKVEVKDEPKPHPVPKHRSRTQKLHPPPGSGVATAILARAEDFARMDETDAALGLYQELIDTTDPKLVPYRPLARYETARIFGFVRDDRPRAEAILRDLAKNAGGEVATEAAFALCELDLSAAPCRARACLRRLSGRAATRAEARALLEHWGLEALTCDR
jgi:hypothetical protein